MDVIYDEYHCLVLILHVFIKDAHTGQRLSKMIMNRGI